MSAPNHKLTETQVGEFIENGFLRIENAYSSEVASAAREILWREMNLSPSEPEMWQKPVVRLGMHSEPPFIESANSEKLKAAYDSLVGEGRWLAPKAVGTFPVRFPSSEDPGDTGWHVDMSLDYDKADFMQWRVNIKSDGRALLMLFLFSDVGDADAPTKLRVGSHLDIARQLLPHGEAGLTLGELAKNGFAESAHCKEAFATGPAGTVYLCHPFVIHSAQPHHGRTPKFMAQPPLLPRHAFDPSLPPSPVQMAIRKGCGLK